jgi:hypothetical protein
MKSLFPRITLAYFALQGLALGIYAVLAPEHYFEHFPGAGHAWVALDGPYNEHLMRDYGALNLALGAVALCALIFASRELVITAAIAEIVYAIPHVAYHLAHPSRIGDASDQFGAIGGLLLNAVLGIALLIYAYTTRATPASRRPETH